MMPSASLFAVDSFANSLRQQLAHYPEIKLAILFGSLAHGQAQLGSDLDLAVAAQRPLPAALKASLIETLVEHYGRPIDLIDLQVVNGPIVQQALSSGRVINCTDPQLYGELIKRMLYHQSDMMPYYRRTLAKSRRQWPETESKGSSSPYAAA